MSAISAVVTSLFTLFQTVPPRVTNYSTVHVIFILGHHNNSSQRSQR